MSTGLRTIEMIAVATICFLGVVIPAGGALAVLLVVRRQNKRVGTPDA